jgi:hypothetical protein
MSDVYLNLFGWGGGGGLKFVKHFKAWGKVQHFGERLCYIASAHVHTLLQTYNDTAV